MGDLLIWGGAEPGAGQIYYALRSGGREVGNVHAFNPCAYDVAAVRTPPIASVQIGAKNHQCRWLANMRMIGIGGRRSFVVREEQAGWLIYESFDYAQPPGPILHPDGVQRTTGPTWRVSGGRESHDAGGSTTFRFANDGYAYVIMIGAKGSATLEVRRGGRALQRERLIGFTFAPR